MAEIGIILILLVLLLGFLACSGLLTGSAFLMIRRANKSGPQTLFSDKAKAAAFRLRLLLHLPLHLHFFHTVDERLQLAAARRMPQLAQCLRFDLPNALARNLEALSYLFQRVL